MNNVYYPPKKDEKKFHCIHCGVYAQQDWNYLYVNNSTLGGFSRSVFTYTICTHCNQYTYWYNDKMIVPAEAPVEPAHPDLPADCLADYNEAREIFARSPRASAALLRLCVQKLMPHLGQKGKNINDDIAYLVRNGLPEIVQQALDFCRVVGNNAVHPGEIDLNDTPETAQQLFCMINFIVEDRISRPIQVKNLYAQLPQSALDAIANRDK